MISVSTVSSKEAIQDCLNIREAVFIKEQNVPHELEQDDYDWSTAIHFLAHMNEQPVGTARIILKQDETIAKIGRVAVLKEYRGKNIGAEIIKTIEACPLFQTIDRFILESQTHAIPFYNQLGYVAEGDEFMDAGIPHKLMVKIHSMA